MMVIQEVKAKNILIVEARYYEGVSDFLLKGATIFLEHLGTPYEVVRVPGALEIPAAISFAEMGHKNFDAYIALGCVIRGETYHFELVSNESFRGLIDLSVHMGLAIGNGILTVDTMEQALERANPNRGNKGGFAAHAACMMKNLRDELYGVEK